jgi:hypothetical protein
MNDRRFRVSVIVTAALSSAALFSACSDGEGGGSDPAGRARSARFPFDGGRHTEELEYTEYSVDEDGETVVYLSCQSPEQTVAAGGIEPFSIIGEVTGPRREGQPIAPESFAASRQFREFLQGVVGRRGPELPGLVAVAKRQREGWVHIIDQRTPDPSGEIVPEDMVGSFSVSKGRLVPNGFIANPHYAVLTDNGFPVLGPFLSLVMEEIAIALDAGG